ncbi:MAG: hypothetical protein ACFBSF_19705 [Leptolyngbyaceae cyanobacterium]
MIRLRTFLPLLVTAALLLQRPQAVLSQSQVITDDAIPANSVLRLLKSLLEVDGVGRTNIQRLFIGQLPDDLAVELPLPDDADILASFVLHGNSETEVAAHQIVLDMPQFSDASIEQYEEQLVVSGWLSIEIEAENPSGFVSSQQATWTAPKLFCRSQDATWLSMATTLQQDNTTMLLLLLSPDTDLNCSLNSTDSDIVESGIPMPSLMPPSEGTVRVTSNAREGNSAEISEAVVESALNPEAIAQHYAVQWEEAGWRPVEGEQPDHTTDDIIQRGWILEDETGQLWQGTLTIEPFENEPGKYTATASVEQHR